LQKRDILCELCVSFAPFAVNKKFLNRKERKDLRKERKVPNPYVWVLDNWQKVIFRGFPMGKISVTIRFFPQSLA
jgi:hypothetical protein